MYMHKPNYICISRCSEDEMNPLRGISICLSLLLSIIVVCVGGKGGTVIPTEQRMGELLDDQNETLSTEVGKCDVNDSLAASNILMASLNVTQFENDMSGLSNKVARRKSTIENDEVLRYVSMPGTFRSIESVINFSSLLQDDLDQEFPRLPLALNSSLANLPFFYLRESELDTAVLLLENVYGMINSSILGLNPRILTRDRTCDAIDANFTTMKSDINQQLNIISNEHKSITNISLSIDEVNVKLRNISYDSVTLDLGGNPINITEPERSSRRLLVDASRLRSPLRNITSFSNLNVLNQRISSSHLYSTISGEEDMEDEMSWIDSVLNSWDSDRLGEISQITPDAFPGPTVNRYVGFDTPNIEIPNPLYLLPWVVNFKEYLIKTWMLLVGMVAVLSPLGYGLIEGGLSCNVMDGNRFLLGNNAVLKRVCVQMAIISLSFWSIGYAVSVKDIGGFFLMEADENGIRRGSHLWILLFSMNVLGSCAAVSTWMERTRISVYFVCCVICGSVLFPLSTFALWSKDGILRNYGVIDSSGGGVMHIPCGVLSLVGCIFVGPRLGRFGDNSDSGKLRNGHKPRTTMLLVSLGASVLWFVHLLFLSIDMSELSNSSTASWKEWIYEGIAQRMFIGVICGCIGCLALLYSPTRVGSKVDLVNIQSALRSSLVSISSCVSVVTPLSGVFVAVSGVALQRFFAFVLENWFLIDDPLETVSVHLVCGLHSMISVGLLARTSSVENGGFLYGNGMSLLGKQLSGSILIMICSLLISTLTFFVMSLFFGTLRSAPVRNVDNLLRKMNYSDLLHFRAAETKAAKRKMNDDEDETEIGADDSNLQRSATKMITRSLTARNAQLVRDFEPELIVNRLSLEKEEELSSHGDQQTISRDGSSEFESSEDKEDDNDARDELDVDAELVESEDGTNGVVSESEIEAEFGSSEGDSEEVVSEESDNVYDDTSEVEGSEDNA